MYTMTSDPSFRLGGPDAAAAAAAAAIDVDAAADQHNTAIDVWLRWNKSCKQLSASLTRGRSTDSIGLLPCLHKSNLETLSPQPITIGVVLVYTSKPVKHTAAWPNLMLQTVNEP